MSDARPAEHFATLDQQEEVARLGMWVFLATEVLFFGGLFLAYAIYRARYPEAFAAAGEHTKIVIGTINTAILLTSSFIMALGVHAAEADKRRPLAICLLTTALLGVAFLVLKGFEYVGEYHEHLVPGLNFIFAGREASAAELFFLLYFIMTGLHALHMAIGVSLLLLFAWRARRGDFSGEGRHMPVTVLGLYWHFVDLVWVFLFPLLYLNGRA